MERFLLIDLNNYFSRFYYANPENCVERYLKMVKDCVSELNPIYFCNLIDGPTSFRKGLYPQYKSQRSEKPKEYYELLNNLKFNLRKISFPQMGSKSLEAEDLANLFVQNLPNYEYIILSNDKDLLQLKSENCHVFDYFNKRDNEGKFQVFVEKSYEEFLVRSSEEFILYLSLCGDSSDNIPGVKGIGDKKAVEIANGFGKYQTLVEYLETKLFFGKSAEDKVLKKIKDDFDNFKLSYQLICLFNENYEFDVEKYKL